MKIKIKEKAGITVLKLSGEMHGGQKNLELVDIVKDLASKDKLDIVINLSKVKWISSTGLGILVSARSSLAKEGGIVKLCEPNDRILGILQVTRLNVIFDVYDSEDEAIASFNE
ncbi:MAG: anti-sigma factor antagonist [Candidatus Latescibacteria bacterium]|nr:anti-sigma factor antagonist [bacterium]MBD3424672.1 anti-sigma factor antagonist [Candidatus Latescibacterota bacterium]